MIDKATAKEQLSRLSRLIKFPDTKASLEDMICALQLAETKETAVACVSHFLDLATSETRCPMPRDIREWINAKQSAMDTAAKQRRAGCRYCNGTGWEIVERPGSLYSSGARMCRCRTGAAA